MQNIKNKPFYSCSLTQTDLIFIMQRSFPKYNKLIEIIKYKLDNNFKIKFYFLLVDFNWLSIETSSNM